MSGEEIIISTQRLRAVREVDVDSNIMICESGVTLGEAQAAALAADRLFPLSLASEGTCTIGGNISTNAGGVTVIAYGNTRDLVTGVEAVLADGRIINALSKLRKDNTGYDLKSLFVGAEGTLGIVTAASLRLFPNPRARATAFVGLKSPEDALMLLRGVRERLGAAITSFELIGRSAYDIALRHGGARAPLQGAHDWYVLIEASSQAPGGFDEAFAGALEAALERASSRTPQSPPRSSSARPSGNCASACPKRRARKGVRSSTTSRSRSAGARLHQRGDACGRNVRAWRPGGRLRSPRRRHIHFNVSQPVGADKQAFLDRWDGMNEIVHGIVARLGGSYPPSTDGQLKRALLADGKTRPPSRDAPDQGDARSERSDEPG